jgi:spore maturation protein CgeB
MRFILYTHSLVSDWNHGNAHFLRGVLRELHARGYDTLSLEPEDSWSRDNLISAHGAAALEGFHHAFPELIVRTYGAEFDHSAAVSDADVVLVHEWTDPQLIARLGRIRRDGGRFTLLFHDTHHRAASDEVSIAELALQDYDAVLAFGEVLRQRYLKRGWGRQVFTWHEAADTRLFYPRLATAKPLDLVWVGNWGDGERAQELDEFLIQPARRLQLSGTVRGVRYPESALDALRHSSLEYRGWIANVHVPDAFAQHRVTVHVPRRPYVAALPGIPTIRVFEALACGIPLVCAPWDDEEALFRSGDFLFARDTDAMTTQLELLLRDCNFASSLAANGLETIRQHHTCAHRVDELLAIISACRGTPGTEPPALQDAAE